MRKLLSFLFLLVFSVGDVRADDFRRLSLATSNFGPGSIVGNLWDPTTFLLDANNDEISWVFQAPAALTITQLCYYYHDNTGNPPVYRISLQGVSTTTGLPDNTVLGGGSPASVTFDPPNDNTWDATFRCETLTNSYTTTRGQILSINIEYSSGTVNGSNAATFGYRIGNGATVFFPYSITVAAGVSTKQTTYPLYAYKTASATYGHPMSNLPFPVDTQFSSDSTPDEKGAKFTLDAGFGSTKKIVGIRVACKTPAASKTVKMALYDGTTELQNITFDSDVLAANAAQNGFIEFYFDEATLSTLNFGTAYRIAFAPQETSANFALYTIKVSTNTDLAAYGGGSNFVLTTRTNAGAWTDTDTERVVAEFIIDDWTEPAGGGGSVKNQNQITGGIQ